MIICAALLQQMERLNTTTWQPGERNNAVDECLAAIERLNHEVKDAASYIPKYDRRSYADVSVSIPLSLFLFLVSSGIECVKKFGFEWLGA